MSIKSFWPDPGGSEPGLGGDGVTSRGSEPTVDMGSGSPLQDLWPGAVVPVPSGEETPNSVSGLPLRPNRWEPSEKPPMPPDLTDRNPGTLKG